MQVGQNAGRDGAIRSPWGAGRMIVDNPCLLPIGARGAQLWGKAGSCEPFEAERLKPGVISEQRIVEVPAIEFQNQIVGRAVQPPDTIGPPAIERLEPVAGLHQTTFAQLRDQLLRRDIRVLDQLDLGLLGAGQTGLCPWPRGPQDQLFARTAVTMLAKIACPPSRIKITSPFSTCASRTM